MFRNTKIMATLFTFMVIGAVFASTASAECGPGFSGKQQLIQYYKHNPSAAHGFRKELLAHSAYSGFQADETVVNYLRSPEQKVFNAPSGYHLTANTFCPAGPGKYQPYGGLLDNMSGKPMLWHCPKGSNCVPLLKGYCMNFVLGPQIRKHHKPPKCKCKKHHKPKKSCQAKGMVNVNGNCVKQTNTAKQECEAKVNGTWNGNQCTIVQINANCSNVAGNEGGTVVQGGNCNVVIVEEHPCTTCAGHWTQISCTGFEEISGGGSFLVDCAVSDDNGAQISLDAHSNNGNSRVSGINCFSNGGSQTCPSGGTFEFRVTGINNGSSVLSSSITATASANGVNATFTSDPFPVDPSEGGF